MQSIPESLLVLLLDWAEPWQWIRQIRDWVVLLRQITSTLDAAIQESMETVMKEWQEHKRVFSTQDSEGSSTGYDGNVAIPLSQGEWDEPLGLPVCVVCHGVSTTSSFVKDTPHLAKLYDIVGKYWS